MARMARIVVPNYPHHVIQRGNRSQRVFFSDADRRAYLEMLRRQCQRAGVAIWAYCLMDNHVHFVAVPRDVGSLARCFGEAHKRYTRLVNLREGWTGYLWQGRFRSVAMDERYLYAAIRYIERNPVEAGLVQRAEEYEWSSAKAHVYHVKDPLLSTCYLEEAIEDWAAYLKSADQPASQTIEAHLRIGRPVGSDAFLRQIEQRLGRSVRRQRPGRQPKRRGSATGSSRRAGEGNWVRVPEFKGGA